MPSFMRTDSLSCQSLGFFVEARCSTEPIVEKEAKSYKLIQVLYTSTHFEMYLNILDTFNNLSLKIENSFLRLHLVAFYYSLQSFTLQSDDS